jgi:hypothetical protein
VAFELINDNALIADRAVILSEPARTLQQTLRRESIILLFFVFFGVAILPLAVYVVGDQVFGEYAGTGLGGFFRDIHAALRAGQPAAYFLVLSPYLALQLFRLTLRIFRHSARRYQHDG